MPDTADLERLEGLLGRATPAPWDGSPAIVERGFCAQIWNAADVDLATFDATEQGTADATLVVALRNAAPALLAELRRLRAENAGLQSQLKECDALVRAMERADDLSNRNE